MLKVAEKTVYTMALRSQLPAFKVGGQVGFSASILIGGSSSRRQTPETRERAEMTVPCRTNLFNLLEADSCLRHVACRIRVLGL